MFENHKKVSFNIASEASYVVTFKVHLKCQKLVKNAKIEKSNLDTVFENHQKCRIWHFPLISVFWHFWELLSTQNVNVARFARNVE